MKLPKWLAVLIEFLEDFIGGFTLSGVGALLIPELIHLFFIIIGGIIGTAVIHFTRRSLRKYFP